MRMKKSLTICSYLNDFSQKCTSLFVFKREKEKKSSIEFMIIEKSLQSLNDRMDVFHQDTIHLWVDQVIVKHL